MDQIIANLEQDFPLALHGIGLASIAFATAIAFSITPSFVLSGKGLVLSTLGISAGLLANEINGTASLTWDQFIEIAKGQQHIDSTNVFVGLMFVIMNVKSIILINLVPLLLPASSSPKSIFSRIFLFTKFLFGSVLVSSIAALDANLIQIYLNDSITLAPV